MGTPRIDNDHRLSTEMAGQLTDAIACRDDKVVSTLLDQFCVYFPAHFYDEEALMRSVGYPDLANHKVQHGEIVAYLSKVRGLILAEGSVRRNIAERVLKWVDFHLSESDVLLADFLRTQAQAAPETVRDGAEPSHGGA
jgi:hemerythrin-like metal-binding protein